MGEEKSKNCKISWTCLFPKMMSREREREKEKYEKREWVRCHSHDGSESLLLFFCYQKIYI